MAAIAESTEIARRPGDVFACVTGSSRFAGWQASVASVRQQGTGPPAAGLSAVVTRQIGPRRLPGTGEITALHPPGTRARRTGGGPVTGTVHGATACRQMAAAGRASRSPPTSRRTGSAGRRYRSPSAGRRAGSCRKTSRS